MYEAFSSLFPSITLWLGSTGARTSWHLEDVCVVEVALGTAYYFPCGWLIRQEATLTAEPLEGSYCVYEVAISARPPPESDTGDALELVPHTSSSSSSGGGGGGGSSSSVPELYELCLQGEVEVNSVLHVTLDDATRMQV